MNAMIKKLIPSTLVREILPILQKVYAAKRGLVLKTKATTIDIVDGINIIRISVNHAVYLHDIITSFDYYFSAVAPVRKSGMFIVDYSLPRYHDVIGYDKHPIMFPSFAEPLLTAQQYMDFANISDGNVVLDLGAYSGLTSIMFSQQVGSNGIVVAVDPDEDNINCIKTNISNFRKFSDNRIEILEGAVWENNDGLEFSSEGNTGSSVASIVGKNRGSIKKVATYTLMSIVDTFSLEHVDFIKCDIEGAENVIFQNDEFFSKFRPKIIIEAHIVNGIETTNKCMYDLGKYGYQCRKIEQKGVLRPLIECYSVDK